MKINELVLYNEPGSVEGHIPFIMPESVKKVTQINGIFAGIKNAALPVITLWNTDPTKNDQDLIMIGAAHLDKLDNGFSTIQTPTIKKEYRGKGYGIVFYTYVLDVLKKNIQSDTIQTPGSAMIWSLLARNPKYAVYGLTEAGKKIPVIADGMRLYVGDQTVYDSPDINILQCIRK